MSLDGGWKEEMKVGGTGSEEPYSENYEVPKIFWHWESITDWTKRTENYTD